MGKEINHKDRAHALLSASSAHRWLECPASAVAVEAYGEQETEFTKEGTLAHEVAEWVASGDSKNKSFKKGINDGVTTEMIDCAIEYRDFIDEHTKSDTATKLLEQRVDFSPWVPEGFGTCDCILIHGDTLTVIDYKYGAGVPVSAQDNPQLKLYALGALNDYGIAYDIKRVEMGIFQPRLNNVSIDEISAEDLLEWGKTIKPIAQKAAKGKGGYKAGIHCRFCQHAGRCRTLTKTCTEYVETHSLRVGVPVLAPHEVAQVLEMEPLIALWLKKVKDQAYNTMMEGGQVPGFKIVEGRSRREWADEIKVLDLLKAEGFSTEDVTKTELLSPAAMEKAIGKKRAGELLADLISKKPGAPTIAPETDKRPAYDRQAEILKDFE